MNTFDIIQAHRTGANTGAMATPFGPPAMPLPPARCAVEVRPAVKDDISFIDYLMKMHGHMVGFAPRKQLESNIEDGQIVIAEDQQKNAVGYCIAKDQYMKRDDVGIVYQLNVLPIRHRSLIGATLVKATFDRAAYGVKLFCCWCAQDIQANFFWESIGFIPLAFRTGSRSKQRIHIFWQRRIREGDETTPYWFPHQTENGAVREDRLAIPIPPGTHWRDAKPVLLPGMPEMPKDLPKKLPGGALVKPRPEQPKVSAAQTMQIIRSKSKFLQGTPPGKVAILSGGKVKYVNRGDEAPEDVTPPKPKKERKPRQKNDPTLVSKARELRDRYLEQVNASMLLPPGACGKYDVSRQLEGAPAPAPGSAPGTAPGTAPGSAPSSMKIEQVRLLDAA